MTRQEFWDAKSKEAQKREKRVISYLKKGFTRDQIAKKLGISAVRVTNLHSRHILRESRDKNDMYANLTIGTLNALRNANIYTTERLLGYIFGINEMDMDVYKRIQFGSKEPDGFKHFKGANIRLSKIHGLGPKNINEIIDWMKGLIE